jgi:tryptophan synthase alpha chain
MTYYNILFKYGVNRFAKHMAQRGLQGAIIPDLPPEEGHSYLQAMDANDLAPIYIFSPTTTNARMAYIASFAKGFVYCVARRGVTGADTTFSETLETYLQRCRQATKLPLALGFGVKDRSDIDFLRGKADIAVIGTQTIRLVEEQGVEVVGKFIGNLT